jgi:hypothetical protein
MADVPNFETPVELWTGPHLFRWEPPDVGYVAYNGDVDGPTMATYSEKSRLHTNNKPRVFLIVNSSKLGRIDAEARRLSANGSKGLALRGVAVVGGSRTIRVLSELFVRAIEILNHNPDNPTRFFEDEADARAWIDTRRRELDQG